MTSHFTFKGTQLRQYHNCHVISKIQNTMGRRAIFQLKCSSVSKTGSILPITLHKDDRQPNVSMFIEVEINIGAHTFPVDLGILKVINTKATKTSQDQQFLLC